MRGLAALPLLNTRSAGLPASALAASARSRQTATRRWGNALRPVASGIGDVGQVYLWMRVQVAGQPISRQIERAAGLGRAAAAAGGASGCGLWASASGRVGDLLQDDMDVGAADAKRADACAPRCRIARPGCQVAVDIKWAAGEIDLRVGRCKMRGWAVCVHARAPARP